MLAKRFFDIAILFGNHPNFMPDLLNENTNATDFGV